MYYLGVDLGGTNTVVGLVTKDGTLLYKYSVKTEREKPYKCIIQNIANACEKVIRDKGINIEQIGHIGIGIPGTCDDETGIIEYAPNLEFKNVNIREELKKYFNLPIYIDNDANCASLGESTKGAAKGYNNSVTITIGTGVGGGIIIDKKILKGAFNGAGEIGHQIIKFGGELCGCGNKGCFESYASATALIRDAKIAAIKSPNTKILELANGDINLIVPKIIFDAASYGDRVAKEVINTYLSYLSVGISNIINIFQPDIIVIGGGISKQESKLLEPLKKILPKTILGGVLKTEISIAKLGNDAGIIGAAMLKG